VGGPGLLLAPALVGREEIESEILFREHSKTSKLYIEKLLSQVSTRSYSARGKISESFKSFYLDWASGDLIGNGIKHVMDCCIEVRRGAREKKMTILRRVERAKLNRMYDIQGWTKHN